MHLRQLVDDAAEYDHSPVRQPLADGDDRLVIGASEVELGRIQPVGAPVQGQTWWQPPQITGDKLSRLSNTAPKVTRCKSWAMPVLTVHSICSVGARAIVAVCCSIRRSMRPRLQNRGLPVNESEQHERDEGKTPPMPRQPGGTPTTARMLPAPGCQNETLTANTLISGGSPGPSSLRRSLPI